MNNWFKVGEEVMVKSPNRPEHNGEYVIKRFLTADEYREEFPGWLGVETIMVELVGLSVKPQYPIYPNNTCAKISSLRKKHPHSNESFKDMMSRLKINSNVHIVEGVI